MITRPLDLASKLRGAPRRFDVWFYVNVGVLMLFFMVFGSRHILSPGLRMDFEIPTLPDPISTAASTDVVIAVESRNMVLVEGAVYNFAQLQDWLRKKVAGRKGLRLLIQADSRLPTGDLAQLYTIARMAGFAGVQVAAERPEGDATAKP